MLGSISLSELSKFGNSTVFHDGKDIHASIIFLHVNLNCACKSALNYH